jgi:hypothetical protein
MRGSIATPLAVWQEREIDSLVSSLRQDSTAVNFEAKTVSRSGLLPSRCRAWDSSRDSHVLPRSSWLGVTHARKGVGVCH